MAVTPGSWHCVEWQIVQGDAGIGRTATWLDGQPVAALQLTSAAIPDLGQLSFGIGFYKVTTQPAYELWIDDIYVDTAPVGCVK